MEKLSLSWKGVIERGLILVMLMCIADSALAQNERKYIRKGNKQYSKNDFEQSEILYRKAEEKDKHAPEATFNTGDALYKQKKYEDAGKKFADFANQTADSKNESAAWYNLGNSLLQAKKISESIEAYKNSLKLNPENMQAKYNLGYAQDLLKEQQQQKENQQQNKDQDNKDNQNKEKDQQKDQQQDNNKAQNQDQQQQSGTSDLSKEDAKRLLDALANDERDIQEKVKREKAAQTRTRVLKNW